jgi:hypothetical protein
MAEEMSGRICEICGDKGSIKTIGNWIQTLCVDDYFQGLFDYDNKGV